MWFAASVSQLSGLYLSVGDASALPFLPREKDLVMNRILTAAGALLIAAASTAAFASPASDAWVAKARAALEAQVAEAGLTDDGKVVKIRVKLGSAGADAVLIAETSGSADFDTAVKAAAKKADLPRPSSDLVGRSVTFTLGQPGATVTGAN